MNKAYKVVWSKVKHCYVVVSELAKSHTKAPKSGIIGRSVVAGVLACVLSCGAVMPVYADVTADYPTGFAQREPGFWSALQNMLDSRYGVGNTEFITGWRSDIGHGSAISFFNIDKSVVGHSTSDESLGVATDGYFFQNEGLYRVLDVSNVSNNNSLYVDNFSGNFGVKYYGINSTEGTNVDGSGAVGPDAIALGKDTLASGNQSISIGVGNQVTGNNSGAIGDPNIVNGDNSYVVGNNSTVHANIKNAFVLGNNTTVSNGLPENWDTMTDAEKEAWANSLETTDVKEGVVALGNNIFVSLDNKSPVSRSSTSEGTPEIEHVVAVGDNVVIGEENAIGIGHTATSTALNTIAMGDDAQATMEGAIAVGHSTRATNAFSNALGYLAQATAEGAGAFGQDARATGKFTVAFGRSTRASAESATAIGNTAHAVSQSSIAIGTSAIANGGANTNAVAIGRGATIGSDTQGYGETLAVGSGTNVQNTFGSALGSSASVTGQKGTAIGYNSSVTATNAVALGADSVANAANTVSVGSASATRKIVNVTDGTANTDASTVNQTGNKLNLSGSTLSLQTLTGTTLDSVTLPQGVSYTAGNGLVLTGTQFSVKSGTNITVDENGVSVNGTGVIDENNTGLINGGTLYNEVNVASNGNYIVAGDTTAQNLGKLDTAVKNVDNSSIKSMTANGTTVTYTKGDGTTGTFTTQDTNTEYTAGNGLELTGTEFKAKAGTNVTVDANGISVTGNGTVASGNTGLVSGGTVFGETRVASDGNYIEATNTASQNLVALDNALKDNADALDGKANVALNNVTDAGHTVIKTDAKSAINVVGGTYATVDKTDVNGVDTYTVNVATDGAVAQGNNKLVTGGTVYDALQAQKTETRTALDGKANVGLDNITDTGKSVVRTLAQESVKVVNGSNTTVTEGTDGTYKTYAVNTKTDGTVVSGDTGIVTGGAVYDAIQNAISGSEAGTANDLSGKANVGLDNITDAGKNVIKSLVNVTGIGNVSVAKTNVSGVDTYTVSVDDDVIKPHYVSINSLSQDADSNYNNDGASGQNAIAIGQEATATAKNAVAIGYKAKAEGEGAFAFGEGATSKGKGTVAFTGGNKAYGTYSMAWGMNNIAGISADGTEIFMGATAFGTGTEARNSGATAMGNWTIAEGQDSVAMGNGSRTREYAKASLAMGQDTQAAGSGSFAGGSDSIAGGFNSFAFGDSAEAAGDYSTAIGDSAKSIGEESVALGYNSKAYGDYSVAILGGRTGNGTFTYDDDTGEYDVDVTDNPIGAFAAGFGSVAMKDYTVAIGRHATVNNDKSMALGEDAIVSADNSVALGTEAVATEQNVISVGHKQGDAKYGGGTYDTALNRRIVNVAEGTNDTDAVNVKQLTEAVGDKANEDLDNITDAGHSVIKSDAKSAINVVGADKATVTKADVNGVDTYTVSVKADGAVADGNENIVSGGTVYNALQAQKNEMNTALDGKANIGLDNITDNGKTVVRTLAQEAVKVVNGTNTTVTEGTDGNAKTYAVNVTTNGTVTSGDTGVVTGGTVYDAIQDIVTGDMTGKANISLDNVNDAGHNVIKTDAKSVIHVAGNEDVTVSKTDVNGVDTYNVALVKDGAVASGEEKVVTGGIVYDALVAETRPAQDGNYIVKDDTAGENLTALDEAVKANEDAIATNAGDITNLKNLSNITEAGKTVIKNLAKGSVNVVGVDKATVTKSDVNGVDTYTVSVKADGQVAQGDINIVSGDTVYQALQTERATTDVALDDKANIGLDNITDAGHTVIKTDAKASITVTGGTDALVTKTDVNGVDTYAVSINKNGAVAQGNEEIVTGGTVYDALQGQRNEINTVLDTKANIDLDNITNNGKTVVRNLAKESVKVISGSEYVTVTEGTDGNAKTYAVGVLVNGAVESGNTGLATGNTVFNEVRVGNDGYYVLKSNTAGQNITVLDRVLKETRDIAEASALTGTDDNAVHYDGTDKSTVTLAGAEGTLLTNLKDGEISATSTDAVTGKQLFETNERIGQVETRVDTLETTVGTMTDGNYIGADKSVGENLSVLDSELKNVSDGLNTVTNDIGELRDDLDGKLNTNMDNLTSDGESVISTIAKNAVKVEGTGLATVTSAEKNNAMVYTVDVQANGKVEEGNTNLVDGGTVYDAVQDAKDYADGLNTETRDYVTEKLKDKADTDLGNITEAGKEKIRETMKDDLDKKANVDASNINPDVWVEKLGVGEVADGNTGLVNGDTVYKALPDVVKADFDAGVIHVGGTPKYDGIGVVDISNSQGEGRVLTGVVTDPGDANSAANVGYVNAIGKSIIQGVNGAMSAMDSKINKVGANAAALASLNPGSLDGDEKFGVAAAIGNYRDATAGAVGLFYKPQDNLTMNVRGSFGTDENMVGAGVYVALNKGNTPGVSKAQLVKTVNAQAERIQRLEAQVAQLIANASH